MRRPSLYDEAVRAALVVLWEASDRVCGKRLRALLPILLPALERNGHLHLGEAMRQKILAMSDSVTIMANASPASAAFGVRLGFDLRLIKDLQIHKTEPSR